MSNGTIEHHLHKACTPLSWIDRLKISIGAARGLDYLHTGVGTQEGVIHRDVKSSNILLDENWAAKISDFGLSKVGPTNQPSSCVSTLVKGTFGYLDPEYSMTGHLTRKSDVYAFGVVLFELLSGRRAVDRRFDEDEWGLANWAQQRVKERRLDQIVCSQISGQVSPKCLKEFAQIADRCLRSSRKDRPTMAEVVVALQLSMTLQQQFITSTQLAGANNSVDSEPKKFRDDGYSGDFKQLMNQEVKVYSYCDMEVATRNFSREMFFGKGDFGEVFRGWFDKKTYKPSKVDRGLAIAVKRLYSDKFEPRKLNMKILEEFKDANVVKVLGYCVEEDSVLIVYEFMHRGTLKDYLFSSERRTERHELITRIKIAIGVGRGLVFLSTKPQLADCSLRIHNIFLDKEFNAKLSDFDVVMLAPTNDFHPSSSYDLEMTIDVFGFGVILLQLLSGKPISDSSDLTQISHCFPGEYGFVSMQSIYSALDDRLRLSFPMRRQVFQLALVAQKCVLEEPSQRPTLELALEEVEEIYDIMLKSENSTDN